MLSKPARDISNPVGRALGSDGAMAAGASLSMRTERAALISLACRMRHSSGLA